MGFFDKVKNMFTEEVEDDIKVEQIKKEVTHVAIETPKIKEEDFELEEKEIFGKEESENTFNRPVFFDDNDFKDLNLEPDDKKEEEKDFSLYTRKLEEKREEKKVFKPTPIISPVYGVLDKNYHKEDIVSRKNYVSNESKNNEVEPSIDSIRNKAYGTLEDELENTLFGNNSILFKQIEENSTQEINMEELDDNVLENLTGDIGKELDELLTKKEKYLEDDNSNKKIDDGLLEFIDSTLYKDGDEE